MGEEESNSRTGNNIESEVQLNTEPNLNKEKIYNNPDFKIKQMMDKAKEELKINVSFHKCKRPKRMAI